MAKAVIVRQMPPFKQKYKKLFPVQRKLVDEAIKKIVADPRTGEEKKGDLKGVFVYKFPMRRQQMLLAYSWSQNERLLLALGVHENFYRDLK